MMCFALLLVAIGISSCKKSETPIITPDAKVQVDPLAIAKIKEMGFKTDGIKESGAFYVVEGDILISKESLSATKTAKKWMNDGGKISQANTNNLIQGNLTNVIITTEDYDIRWFYAIRDAVTAWNEISNCRINLIHSYNQFYPPYSTSVTPTITMKKSNLGTGSFGQGQMPTSSGTAGAVLLVNPFTNNVNSNGQDNGIPRSRAQDVYMLVHEIGHCLGLRHTDWKAEGTGGSSVGANPIPGTPSSGEPSNDPNSVMNSGRLGTSNSWSAFSSYDITAAQYLYPPLSSPALSTFKDIINGGSSFSVGGTVISTAGTTYSGNYYEWRMLDQNLNIVLPVSSFTNSPQQEWGYSNTGTYFLECRVVGLECAGEWARQTITFN
jgi:predicted Zn-dependent protease